MHRHVLPMMQQARAGSTVSAWLMGLLPCTWFVYCGVPSHGCIPSEPALRCRNWVLIQRSTQAAGYLPLVGVVCCLYDVLHRWGLGAPLVAAPNSLAILAFNL